MRFYPTEVFGWASSFFTPICPSRSLSISFSFCISSSNHRRHTHQSNRQRLFTYSVPYVTAGIFRIPVMFICSIQNCKDYRTPAKKKMSKERVWAENTTAIETNGATDYGCSIYDASTFRMKKQKKPHHTQKRK
jgi:hypothetical protein